MQAQCVNDVVVSESSTAHETKHSTIYFLLGFFLVFRLIHYSATKWKMFGLKFVPENFKWFLIYIELTPSESSCCHRQ